MPVVTIDAARQALAVRTEYLKSLWLEYALDIEYDGNNPINYSTQTKEFLTVSLIFMDGWQINLGANPDNRVLGNILIEALCKDGSPVKTRNRLLEHFYRGVHMTDSMPPLRTYAARIATGETREGWKPIAAIIPFWYDSSNA